MKTFLPFFATLFFLGTFYQGKTQSHIATPRSDSINAKCGGYYEFLPGSYNNPDNNSKTYPLIIDITGSGGQGNGSVSALNKLLKFDTPYFIDTKAFPDTFYSNGQPYSFIVIAPQFSSRGNGADVQAVIDYVLSRYRVDSSRIYVTGFSNGGEPAWSYPSMGIEAAAKIAALVPVAGVNTNINHEGANFFAEAKLPVWALHSTEDNGEATRVENSINFVNAINSYSPVIPAELTLITGTHGETWTKVYDPAIRYAVGGKNFNIYEWMLQYQRVSSALPVTLQSFNAVLSASNSVQLTWTTASEHNNNFFTIERSGNGNVFTEIGKISSSGNGSQSSTYSWLDAQPFDGLNYYRLSQTDVDGKQTFFDIVSININRGSLVVRVFPTLIRNEPLKIVFNDVVASGINIRIIDMNGRVVYKNTFVAQSPYVIPSERLSPGLNMVEIVGDSIYKKIKILKIN